MSLVDFHAKGGFEAQPCFDDIDAWFVDADDVIFRYGERNIYPDAKRFLSAIDTQSQLAIVTSNTDKELNQARQELISPRTFVFPDEGHHAPWNKYGLYRKAAESFISSSESERLTGFVIDDRWFMGSVVGKFALLDAGFDEAKATFLDRGEEPHNIIDEALQILQKMGVHVLSFANFDEFIRPSTQK